MQHGGNFDVFATHIDTVNNSLKEGADSAGRPFKIYQGENARVVVNPESGKIVSTNPLSGAGAN
jgi:hypothetical protein